MTIELITVSTVDQIHVGDIGTEFNVFLVETDPVTEVVGPVDVTGATTRDLKFERPDGTGFTKVMTIIDGLAGHFRYISIAGDINAVGPWKAQPFVVLPGGWSGHANPFTWPTEAVISGS